jgi:hypothetical protein
VQIERQYQANLARSRMKNVEGNRSVVAFSLEFMIYKKDMISVPKAKAPSSDLMGICRSNV